MMKKTAFLKNKYIAVLMCILIVLTVAGGNLCLWHDNPVNSPFFGAHILPKFQQTEPITLSGNDALKFDAWIENATPYSTENNTDEHILKSWFLVSAVSIMMFITGQARFTAKKIFANKSYFLRI